MAAEASASDVMDPYKLVMVLLTARLRFMIELEFEEMDE